MKSGDVLSGKYRLEQEIGKGAMGAVWSAFDHALNRRVALKAILPQAREQLTNDLRHRLLREARACGKLRHRHIVRIFDVGETPEGEPFLILELLHGQTLADRLKEKRRIEPAMAAHIAAEVASGLAVAHAAHVIHRDLKPANIFLHREEGMPEDTFVSKVLDFGVCKSLDSVDSVATQTGTAVGSPAYMSPEQVGMRKDIDHRTDLWSLGIVLFEMLTGARPFSGSVHEVIRNILLTPVPPPSSKVRDVPPELDAIVARCTAGKREARYANADELATELFALARTVRPMTRKPTFTGVGPTPSMYQSSSMERPAFLVPTNTPTPLPVASTRSATSSAPPGVDESELVATLPLQAGMLMDLRPSAPQPARRDSAPTGTEFLPPDQTPASPAPAWNKNEMQQALAAHRRSHSSSLDLAGPEQGATGHTQPVTDSQMHRAPGMDPVGTTSNAGALAQRTTGYPAPPHPLMAMDPVTASGRRKKTNTLMLWMVSGGSVAALGVVIGLIVMGMGGGLDAPVSASEAKPVGSQAAVTPTAPEPAAPMGTTPPSTTADVPAAAPAPTAEPSATGTPSVTATAPPPPSPAPAPTPQAPNKPVFQPPPPKPTSSPPSTSTAKMPNPFVQKAPPPPAPAPCKWVGTGLTRKCVK